MDNFLPFSSSNANSVQEFSMDVNSHRSHFTTIPTYDHQAQPHHLLPPYSYPVEQMAAVMNPHPLYSSEGFPQIPVTQTGSEFSSLKLRVLCVKHLKNSDVGSLGRIVLPKREAEGNLPELSDKDGIIVEMRDVFSLQSWSFKYKFWSNNKSRMYVLENTGEFVKQNGVEMGDSLTIYEDESKNLYFAIRKSGKQNLGRGDESTEMNEMNPYEEIMFDHIPRDEEEASIAMLIGNLSDHYPNPNDLMGLTLDLQHHQATSSLPSVDHAHVGLSDDQVSFNDFVW